MSAKSTDQARAKTTPNPLVSKESSLGTSLKMSIRRSHGGKTDPSEHDWNTASSKSQGETTADADRRKKASLKSEKSKAEAVEVPAWESGEGHAHATCRGAVPPQENGGTTGD